MGDSNQQQVDQLLRGIYRMCVNRDDCKGCPFYITKCTFEEPKPSTWFDEETIEIKPEPVAEKPVDFEFAKHTREEPVEEPVQEPAKQDDSDATWLVSTTMGSVFTKYVFICSKCGFKKESIFSITPTSYCPECAKRKAGNA